VEAVCWEFASEWAAQGVICISVEVFRGAHVFEPANVQQLTSDLRDQDQVIYEWANELVATLMGHFARQRDTPRQPS
jgi:hypothetical protein